MQLPEQWQFIFSVRFWAMELGIAAFILQDPATTTSPWYVTLGKFITMSTAGFVGIRTVDRATEKLGKTEVEAKEDIKEKE